MNETKENRTNSQEAAAQKTTSQGMPSQEAFSRETRPSHENHNYRRHRSHHASGSGTGSEQELVSLRIEYQNLFDRSNKLDNKVYITVTFLGFMFVFITSLFGSIPTQLHMSGTWTSEGVLSILYIIVSILVAVTYVWNLVYFMRLLAPEQIIRLDPDKIAAVNLESLPIKEAEQKLVQLYRGIINEDLEKLHVRCDKFVDGLRFVIITLVLSFVTYALQVILRVLA